MIVQLLSHSGRLYALRKDGTVAVAEINHDPRVPMVKWVTLREDMSETMRPAITQLLADLEGRSHA